MVVVGQRGGLVFWYTIRAVEGVGGYGGGAIAVAVTIGITITTAKNYDGYGIMVWR